MDAKPILIFDNGFDWKQVFDAGFRPRHRNGGRVQCMVIKQEPFSIQIKGIERQMEFGEGNLRYYFDSKEKLTGISYFSQEAFDMAEGQKRVDAMTEWLSPYIIHHMKMPKYIEGTFVDAGARGCSLVARIGEYRISYHFIDTRRADRQLMAEFSVGRSFPGMPTEGFIPLDRKIKPPPGYEDWDMTEVIPTSNGDKRIENTFAEPFTEIPPELQSLRKKHERDALSHTANEARDAKNPRILYSLFAAILAIVMALLYAYRQKRQQR